MVKKIKLFMIMAVAIPLMLVGCETTGNKNETNDKLDVVNYIDFKIYDANYIGIEKGIFEKHGIDLQLASMMAGGPNALQVVSSGKANAGMSSLMAIINANGSGLPIVAVADLQSSIEGAPLEEWFVRKGENLKDITDLKGKNVAINLANSSFHYSLLIEMEKHGMAEDDVNFVQLSFQDQIIALEQGAVDMIGLMSPLSAVAKSMDEFERILTAEDIFGEKQFSSIFLNKVWAEENPEIAERYVTAYAESAVYAMENPEEASKIIAKWTDVDEELIAPYKYQENAKMIIDDVQYWIDYMLDREDANATWLEAEEIATNKYNKLVK